MSKILKFFRTVDFNVVSADKSIQDSHLMQAGAIPGRSLVAKIAATHAGLITRNNGFYLPEKMRKGVSTFTEHYAKPVQLHHNKSTDPVGRIVKAEYIDTSNGIKDKIIGLPIKDSFGNTIGKLNDRTFDNFINGNLSFIQTVNFISDTLAKSEVLQDPSWDGLGYALITAIISDQDAIQKILDKRYLTGSVGVSTNKAICSVCKLDWADEGSPCEHKPGKIYDGAKAFLITGDLAYDEYSFVNVPADRHSGVLEINADGIKDSFELTDISTRKKSELSIQLSDGIDLQNFLDTINTVS